VTGPWRVWRRGGVVGGATFGMGKLTFASVRGAGHMVPGSQPELAYHLV
jgi:serine carboxypeptidase-like clade 2